MNELMMIYEREKSLGDAYSKAKDNGEQEEMQTIQLRFQSLRAHIEDQGLAFTISYRLFRQQQERGNTYIDINDSLQDADVPALIEKLRELGIKHFTFSSTWSSAVETAWIFTNCGCSIKGMIEIAGHHKSFFDDKYERVPAYLFSID